MFDKNRLTRVLPGESTFRIFYELLDSGDTPLLQELGLDLLKKDESVFFDFDQQVYSRSPDLNNEVILYNSYPPPLRDYTIEISPVN